ncbi:extracellular solute-binding protein [Streptomyces sp. MK37H]|uniref:extracellular solute-binding protein n=1 Tax=Streptomyces sp. MK37H TaxID=2699117 RepID=UPI001B38C61A|nr:extracellular solute-binding protein [Streptomyces sp. MK37H]MBP8532402.1 extracellular solute-binding protein [Streptomyces sp. MK37H]
MHPSRRGLLRAGLATTSAAVLGGAAAGCAVPAGSTGRNMTLWYWGGGLSDKLVEDAAKRFTQVDLKATQIGGYFRSKLLTTLTARAYAPDITGLKGEDIASLLSNADQFIDLNTLGADRLKSQYLDWKWAQGTADDGRQIGFPIDTGPCVHYYRPDVFAKAGLPTEPAEVSAAMSTWEDYFTAGERLVKRVKGAYLVNDLLAVLNMGIGQSAKRFVDKDRHFIGDQEHIVRAWDLALECKKRGLVSPFKSGTVDQTAALEDGRLPSQLGASWAAGDFKSQLTKSAGKWRVAAMPERPANDGGSFLGITKYCRRPEVAFEIITWLLGPKNQTRGFVEASLFPSTPASYEMAAMREHDPFFGGQITNDIFARAAQRIQVAYNSPYDVALKQPIMDELTSVHISGKNPERAWRDAMSTCRRIADHLGVS